MVEQPSALLHFTLGCSASFALIHFKGILTRSCHGNFVNRHFFCHELKVNFWPSSCQWLRKPEHRRKPPTMPMWLATLPLASGGTQSLDLCSDDSRLAFKTHCSVCSALGQASISWTQLYIHLLGFWNCCLHVYNLLNYSMITNSKVWSDTFKITNSFFVLFIKR